MLVGGAGAASAHTAQHRSPAPNELCAESGSGVCAYRPTDYVYGVSNGDGDSVTFDVIGTVTATSPFTNTTLDSDYLGDQYGYLEDDGPDCSITVVYTYAQCLTSGSGR